ncbi:MAG: hypothetical protein NTY08_14560 [Proteobacteria bacterium]|nr:hypothetical protein [Pseudomonadota bacterium]
MLVRTLPVISQPDLMPHGSGYISISTGGILGLPRGSDSLIPRWWRHCGVVALDGVLNSVGSAPNIITLRSMLRGSALGLAHRISFGEQGDL